ncbi:hypothetical protein [Paenibacillus sp. SSG-1]|uniref:hypothetical protein n=1 Tax=Paenibacillus sp. SSG-1 TaxID=1443669 RepID=UPI001C52DC66|nr:hypothetical protein [Paenibacillus sp. SSG-1]
MFPVKKSKDNSDRKNDPYTERPLEHRSTNEERSVHGASLERQEPQSISKHYANGASTRAPEVT